MGKIELDHTGSGSGVTLSSDGTDLLLNGTAIGGGGGTALELYAENYDGISTKPSATGTNAVAIGRNAAASNSDAFSFGYAASAQGQFSLALGAAVTAGNAQGSTAIGYTANSQGTRAVALGNAYASGTDSFAAAIANNTSSYGATGANSVAIGELAKATGTDAIAIGASSTASGSQSFAAGFGHNAGSARAVVLGYQSSATSTGAIAIGNSCASSQGYAISLGNGASAAVYGKMAHSADTFAAQGDAQSGQLVLNAASADATPVVMTSNGLTGFLSNNQIILPNNSAYAFHGTIVARQQASAGTACAAWKIEGLIRREGSAGTTVLVNSATTVIDNTPSWGMALSADTTNGGLAITVTGAAATNIRWVATIHTSEVTY